MIGSLLIANRGEIARRVIRTARRLGVRTVAVYSEADAGAAHVREADQAIAIGPAPAAESYLVGGNILAAARAAGVEAIHPGYGFLSENAAFAEAVIAAGLAWVGPPPAAIRAMGLKDQAKALMAPAGVPVTPGYFGEDQSPARLAREADAIGYPLLIKAVAGGGGKGMRRVGQAADFEGALAGARREAMSAFGDERVLLERFIERPRHIEVQVFADRFGGVVHLFERDCSIQRRFQKVIEEAPAPGMTQAVRAEVCGAAVRAARAVGYEGAGTIEFIADNSQGLRADHIWFMEMNTRLQVEHPVTELVTGQDLVEWQLRVASGEPLPLTQDKIRLNGWAMEARLYAEDPATGFLPSSGPLKRLRLPHDVRVDAGPDEGEVVSPFYDPMIAKLIAGGETRDAAAARLAEACRTVEVWPVKTNAGFLARVLDHPEFRAGGADVGFIDRRLAELVGSHEPSAAVIAAGAALRLAQSRGARSDEPWEALAGFRIAADPSVEVGLQFDDHAIRATVDASAPAGGLAIDGRYVVFSAGEAYAFGDPRPTQAQAQAAEIGDSEVRSPMPGKITAMLVTTGDSVAAGQPLAAVEAMKMEHTLRAPFDGLVAAVLAQAGDQVVEGETLIRMER